MSNPPPPSNTAYDFSRVFLEIYDPPPPRRPHLPPPFFCRPFIPLVLPPQVLRSTELELKTLTSRLKQYMDGRNHAERAVSNMLEKFPWIKEDRPFFGRPQTDYDFEARDPATAQERLRSLQEEQASLSKKVGFVRRGVYPCRS